MPQGLSRRIDRLVASPIREILAAIDRPGMVSFAGGLPATSLLPSLTGGLSKEALQYGASEGDLALRDHIAAELCERGLPVGPERVVILSGSQQGIDLVAKLTTDEGSPVAVESPTYLAALQTFSLFGAHYLPYDVDALAMTSKSAFSKTSPVLLYTNPTFRNPDSLIYDLAQRRQLAAECDRLDTILFEDDPYRELVYEPCDRTPVCSLVKRARWVYQSSYSKTTAPGLRLGYLVCSADLHAPLLHLKQAADLHSSRVCQQLLLSLLQSDEAQDRLQRLRDAYRLRRNDFDEHLRYHFDDLADWSRPAGGLFFWLNLRSTVPIDTRQLLPDALASGVAFMPGEPFYADARPAASALRLNFSHAEPDVLDRALGQLANLVRQSRQC